MKTEAQQCSEVPVVENHLDSAEGRRPILSRARLYGSTWLESKQEDVGPD